MSVKKNRRINKPRNSNNPMRKMDRQEELRNMNPTSSIVQLTVRLTE